MTSIEEHVVAEAIHEDRWTFEGKDTLEWLAEAERYRRVAERASTKTFRSEVHIAADELYLIAGRLQALDNNEEV